MCFTRTPGSTIKLSFDEIDFSQIKNTRSNKNSNSGKQHRTIKNFTRHFVKHAYHDLSSVNTNEPSNNNITHDNKGIGNVGNSSSNLFPKKLYEMLADVEKRGLEHIVSWAPHGRCFLVHKKKQFVAQILPTYFSQSKIASFQRQLNLYSFSRLTQGPDKGGYYHELFLRGKPALCKSMTRTKVKGTKIRGCSNPQSEPDFYKMSPLAPTSASTSTLVEQPIQQEREQQHQAAVTVTSSASASTSLLQLHSIPPVLSSSSTFTTIEERKPTHQLMPIDELMCLNDDCDQAQKTPDIHLSASMLPLPSSVYPVTDDSDDCQSVTSNHSALGSVISSSDSIYDNSKLDELDEMLRETRSNWNSIQGTHHL